SGNNVEAHGDTADRTLVVRLRCDHPNPRSRPPKDFRLPGIEGHVRQERALYLSAALTVWRAWVLGGCQRPPGEHWGSFEEFVDGPVAIARWLGLGNPVEGRAKAASEQDREGRALDTLLSMWDRLFGRSQLSCSELIKRLDGEAPSAEVLAILDALAAL